MSTWTAVAEGIAGEIAGIGRGAAWVNSRAWRAGVDPEATRGLVGAALSLGASSAALMARDGLDPLHDDREMMQAAQDLEADAAQMLKRCADLHNQAARERHRLISLICDSSGATYRMLHISDSDRAAVMRGIADCECAMEILDVLVKRLRYAAVCLSRVGDDLESAFEAAYAHVRTGGVLPHAGAFLTAGART